MGAAKLLPYFSYETIHEVDWDGDVGNLMGFLIDGHLDPFEVECFLAREVEEEMYDGGPTLGFNVDLVYWRAVPFYDEDGNPTGSFTYVYDRDASAGGKAATRLEMHHCWDKRCVNHPDKVAVTGIPGQQIVMWQQHLVDSNGYVYMCQKCTARFEKRRAAAIARERALEKAL